MSRRLKAIGVLAVLGALATTGIALPPDETATNTNTETQLKVTYKWKEGDPFETIRNEAGKPWQYSFKITKAKDNDARVAFAPIKHLKGPDGEGVNTLKGKFNLQINDMPAGVTKYEVKTLYKKHVDHHDVGAALLTATRSAQGIITDVTVSLFITHQTTKEDGNIEVGFQVGKEKLDTLVWSDCAWVLKQGDKAKVKVKDQKPNGGIESMFFLMMSENADTAFGGSVELPLDLTAYGAPGYQLLVDPVLKLPGIPSGDHWDAFAEIEIPFDDEMVGKVLWCQWAKVSPKANSLGLVFSPAFPLMVVE